MKKRFLAASLATMMVLSLAACGDVYKRQVLDALRTGIDVILFSGDKLLGGPQGLSLIHI